MFSSKLAFILTAVGAAVGLGNVFRFPYLAMKYGLSFVLVYILFLCLLGLPLLLSEIAFGRAFAFKKADRKTALLSRFCSFNSFFVFGYYTLLFAFVIMAATGSLGGNFSSLSALSEGSSSGGHTVNVLFLIFAFAAAAIGVYALISLIAGKAVPGWTSTMLSIWLIGGVQLIALGLIGEYIGKIYTEVKRRPRFIVEEHLTRK